jgi:hypothetical protein
MTVTRSGRSKAVAPLDGWRWSVVKLKGTRRCAATVADGSRVQWQPQLASLQFVNPWDSGDPHHP